MNTTSLNSATGSVLGLAELIGISHGKMRTLIGWKIQCKLPPKTKRFCPLVLK